MVVNNESGLDLIRKNIAEYGRHIYIISGDAIPRFAYTIGLFPKLGVELILAGGYFYSTSELQKIINQIAESAESEGLIDPTIYSIDSLGTFELNPVHESW